MIVKRATDRATFRPEKMGKVDLVSGEHLFSGLNAFEPGQAHEPHSHCDRDKLYVVLEGQGDVTVGDDTQRLGPGDIALAPAGVVHSVVNPGPARLVTLIVMSPPPGS